MSGRPGWEPYEPWRIGTYCSPTAYIPMTPPCDEPDARLSPAASNTVWRAWRAEAAKRARPAGIVHMAGVPVQILVDQTMPAGQFELRSP